MANQNLEEFVYVPDCRIHIARAPLKIDKKVIAAAREAGIDLCLRDINCESDKEPLHLPPEEYETLLKHLNSRMLTKEEHGRIIANPKMYPELHASLIDSTWLEVIKDSAKYLYFAQGKYFDTTPGPIPLFGNFCSRQVLIK